MIRGTVARLRAAGRSLTDPNDPPPGAVRGDAAAHEVAAMLRVLGVAMLESGQATNEIEDTLTLIARAYAHSEMRVIVLPTVLMIQVTTGDTVSTEIGGMRDANLRLDQIGAIASLVTEAVHGRVEPRDVADQVRDIRASRPRFSGPVAVLGHTLLTLGFGLALNPTLAALPAYVLLGAWVGLLLQVGRRVPTLREVMPIVAAISVTILTNAFLAEAVGDEPLRVLAPPLVSFLPGQLLTTAAFELTNSQIVAGASRAVYGIAQLMMLAFGVAVGTSIVGDFPQAAVDPALGFWAPVAGVLLTAVGFTLFTSAPKGSLRWFVVMLAIVFTVQQLAGLLMRSELTGFFGALVIIPLARLVARAEKAPRPIVLMLPSFLLLVPGAIGFIGVSQAATSGAKGLQALVTTAVSLFSISLGMLVGTGLVRDARRVRQALREAR